MKKVFAVFAGVTAGSLIFWIIVGVNDLIMPDLSMFDPGFYTVYDVYYLVNMFGICWGAFWGGWVGVRILGKRSNLVTGVIGFALSLWILRYILLFFDFLSVSSFWDLMRLAGCWGLPFLGAKVGERALG